MSRKQGILVIVAFLLAFTSGVVLRIPASILLEQTPIPPEVRLQGVDGTILQGRIDRLDVDGFVLRELRYRLMPSCLLSLKLCVNLQSDQDELEANLQRTLFSSDINVVASRVKLPATMLNRVSNPLVKPQGDFILRVESLLLSAGAQLLDVQAVVDWQGASIEGEEQVLGDFRADLSSSEEGMNVRLSANPDNLLGADGEINLAWQGGYNLDLSLTTHSELNSSLRSVVESFARKNGLNRYRLKQTGQLPVAARRILERLAPVPR